MKPNKISVFEYDKLKCGVTYNDVRFDETLLNNLERLAAKDKTKFYQIQRNGVQFCEYVGVIQVGNIQIEILPKLDRQSCDTTIWRNLLIGMLRESGMFRVSAPSSGMLKIKSDSILNLYFELFITELEYLIRTGLIKQYRKQASNQKALKGSIDFPRHLAKNLVHKERFFTTNSIYDYDHIWHAIFNKAISLIRLLSQNVDIHNRIGALYLNFPEVSSCQINEKTFQNLSYSRKTESYRPAIEIAKMLLLRFHPDLAAGANPVLALMFDMNLLWESFIYHSLRKMLHKHQSGYSIHAQTSKTFWQSTGTLNRYYKTLRPDIILKDRGGKSFVLDTKWKVISDRGPSSSDLQQLFAYSQLFKSSRNALVYPGHSSSINEGRYSISTDWADVISCSMIQLGISSNIRSWQESIYESVSKWLNVT